MHPVLIQIGPLVIRWYGVMIAIACLLGIWVAGREAEKKDSSDGIIVIDMGAVTLISREMKNILDRITGLT